MVILIFEVFDKLENIMKGETTKQKTPAINPFQLKIAKRHKQTFYA